MIHKDFFGFILMRLRILKLRLFYRLKIMSGEKTIESILDHKYSIARFGDGEFNLMLQHAGIGFQDKNEQLSERLKEVLFRDNPNLLVCIPGSFNCLSYRKKESKDYWKKWALSNSKQKQIVKAIWNNRGREYVFGDSQITRPYIAYKGPRVADIYFPLLKKLWDNRDILVVEGKKTCLGIGNDFFDNTKSIERIIAPEKNAFNCYDSIISTVKKHAKRNQLILLALGPTATVLAYDLSLVNIQALDVGHVDVEYEWYKAKVDERILLPGKAVNELNNGSVVEDCKDPIYLSQIIAVIN